MPKLLPSDARDGLGPAIKLIRECVLGGWTKLNALLRERGGRYGGQLKTRTRAALLHDFIVEEAVERLAAFGHFMSNDVDLWYINGLVIRFKKLGDHGLPQNVKTKHNASLCNKGEQLEIFEDIKHTYLTVGYDVASNWMSLGDIWVMCMVDDDEVAWSLALRDDASDMSMDSYAPELIPDRPKRRVVAKGKERRPKEA